MCPGQDSEDDYCDCDVDCGAEMCACMDAEACCSTTKSNLLRNCAADTSWTKYQVSDGVDAAGNPVGFPMAEHVCPDATGGWDRDDCTYWNGGGDCEGPGCSNTAECGGETCRYPCVPWFVPVFFLVFIFAGASVSIAVGVAVTLHCHRPSSMIIP